MKTGHLCIPRPKPTSSSGSKARRFTPVSLLERFREAVFRLIMISALSPSSASSRGSPESDPASTQSLRSRSQSYYYDYNSSSHQSEAVADCIEFIKKKACPDDELEAQDQDQEECDDDEDDSISGPAFVVMDAPGELEVVMPMPVM